MSKSISITTDDQLIKSLLRDDYDQTVYDGCPSLENFRPDFKTTIWFVLKENDKKCGLIKLENLNWVTWIPHIVIKKECRGPGSEQWGKLVIEHMNSIFKDLQFLVITHKKQAKNYVEKLGFKFIGMLPKSIKVNGELLDQYILRM